MLEEINVSFPQIWYRVGFKNILFGFLLRIHTIMYVVLEGPTKTPGFEAKSAIYKASTLFIVLFLRP